MRDDRWAGWPLTLFVFISIFGTTVVLAQVFEDDPREAAPPPAPALPVEVDSQEPEALLAELTVAPDTGTRDYDRALFGDTWATQGDGCDTRHAVLAAESFDFVAHGPRDPCDIEAGDWVSLYDGYRIGDPGELEVDHVVPLAEAWASGAAGWSDKQRRAFANDLGYDDALIAVTAAANQAKSDKDPAEWLPPTPAARCRYATAWVTQKARWELSVNPAERDALRNILARCAPQESRQ